MKPGSKFLFDFANLLELKTNKGIFGNLFVIV